MDLTGESNGRPQKNRVAFADIFTALYGVIAVQAALTTRNKTGKGCHIDISLLDSMTGVLANQALNHFAEKRLLVWGMLIPTLRLIRFLPPQTENLLSLAAITRSLPLCVMYWRLKIYPMTRVFAVTPQG